MTSPPTIQQHTDLERRLDHDEILIRQLQGGAGGGGVPVGAPIVWLVAAIPSGYLEFNGQAITAAAYPELFALYGASLPDLRDRFLIGASATRPVGSTGGAATHVLSVAELPSHNHGGLTGARDRSQAHSHDPAVAGAQYVYTASVGGALGNNMYTAQHVAWTTAANDPPDHLHGIGAQGGGGAHNNLPPYRAVRWITVAA
jgi:microcystin-dependent protein